ncbi:hypothetical protein B0H13DRAFT_2000553 [Mycena leptocephala]|nr:hypothetical protein B0H13DRAFT_2000553 [Mycena leptocephala]
MQPLRALIPFVAFSLIQGHLTGYRRGIQVLQSALVGDSDSSSLVTYWEPTMEFTLTTAVFSTTHTITRTRTRTRTRILDHSSPQHYQPHRRPELLHKLPPRLQP